MTVYPFVIHLGSFTITGYGLMMMAAFLMSGWIFARELERAGFAAEIGWDSVVWAVVGGIVGAKVYFALLVGEWAALVSRGGLVWYGGFAGGALAVAFYMWWKKLPVLRMADVIAPALAAGYAIGRVGCFLVGDDYGLPTDAPWGMRFPQGAPPSTAGILRGEFHVPVPGTIRPETVMAVHPTQLYEVGLTFLIFVALWRLARRERPLGWVAGMFLVLMGIERLVIEAFRAKDDRFFGPLTLAQVISVGLIALGAALIARRRAAPASTAAAALGILLFAGTPLAAQETLAARSTVNHAPVMRHLGGRELIYTHLVATPRDGAAVVPGDELGRIQEYPLKQSERHQVALDRARTLYTGGHFLEAAAILRGPVADEPDNPFLLNELGRSLFRVDSLRTESRQVYERLVALLDATAPEPGGFVIDMWFVDAYWKLGMLLLDVEDYPRALEQLARLALTPPHPATSETLYGYLAETFHFLGDQAAADHYVALTLRLYPSNTYVGQFRARQAGSKP